MFKIHSDYKPTGDQPQAIEYLSKRCKRRKKISNFAWCNRKRKNIHNGKYNRKSAKANTALAHKDNFISSSKSSFQKTT